MVAASSSAFVDSGVGMASSAVRTFSDPDDYSAAIRATRAEVVVTGRGQFTAKLIRIDLDRLWMQRFSDNLPRVGHSASMTGRAIISFRTQPRPSLLLGTAEMHPTNIVRAAEGGTNFQRSSGPANWGSMSLPVGDMASVGAAMAGCDLTPLKDQLTVTPAPHAMARLQRLHAATGRLAEDAPEIIANPDAARGLEQALIEAMVECLGRDGSRENSLAQAQHAIVMRRFRRVIEENQEHPLYIPEICKAIGASSRTLQVCCHEHLGMGPKHYLLLRRMNLAHWALRQSAPEAASVTEIAMRYGFWQLGRFAVEYQSLFGASPSATLARQFA
jgi:AraC-like DNA-binding protein